MTQGLVITDTSRQSIRECAMTDETAVIPFERIAAAIYVFRGEKVRLDRDLAALYGVETKVLKQAVDARSRIGLALR